MVKKFRKPTKTISGVAPLAVMLPPHKCSHGVCLFCPTLNAPQSYTPESPAVLRAKSLDYDPEKQVKARLEAFKAMGHPTDKIELIIMGGTFLDFDKDFQYDFIKECYDALNNNKSKTLEKAKENNEVAKNRCVALCVEIRPDSCSDSAIKDMLKWGVTRVEVGVQAVSDKLYKVTKRGHKTKDVVLATEKLKKAGFKVGYHLMPGLPKSSMKKDIKMFKRIFSCKKFRPDQIKIYPCQVLKGAELEEWYYAGKYCPYDKEQTKSLILRMIKLTPRYCRIMRVMREIPPSFLTAGVINIDLRRDIEKEIREKGWKIDEIRFREIGFALREGKEVDENICIRRMDYIASNGKEIFLEAVNKDNILFGLLRLRLDKELKGAMVRELHVYGPALKLNERHDMKWQHKGLGKELMAKAEGIAKEKGFKKIRVISGVGVRDYYRKLEYVLDNNKIYMEKKL